jgi:hypothetical protein
MTRTAATRLLTVLLLASLLAGCSSRPDPETELGGISTIDYLDGLVQRTGRALGSIRGMESANAAAPKLEQISIDYDDLLYHAPKLSPEGREKLAKAARGYWPQLESMDEMIRQSPVLTDVLGAHMLAILEKHTLLMSPVDGEQSEP